MMACCALFMASCGSGYEYVDDMLELNEKTISDYEEAKTEDDVYLATGLYVEEVKRISTEHQAEVIELAKMGEEDPESVKYIEDLMKESIDKLDAAKNAAIERVGIDLEELAKENAEEEAEEEVEEDFEEVE